MRAPETHYLKTADGVYIAYQIVGGGAVDIAVEFNFDEGNVDLMWEEPDWRPFLVGMASFGRVILHDRRGTGVSSRNVPPPNLETRVADLLALLDHVGSTRPVLAAGTDGGVMHALFAATHPNRTSALAWNNPAARAAWAPDYPWGDGPEAFKRSIEESEFWGTTGYGRAIAVWRAAEHAGIPKAERDKVTPDPELIDVYARVNRNTASPDVAQEITRIWWQTDVRAILPAVQVPTALVVGERDEVEEARYVASLMPNATVHVVAGRSGNAPDAFLEILRQLAGIEQPAAAAETVLKTILFTDIVDSTAKQTALGDRAWKELVVAHHAIVRGALGRWRGTENDTAGDGFYATFDGPARAVHCAREVAHRVSALGIEIRAGVHIGECEVIDGKVGGLAVTIGARIAAKAGRSQVLVSQTVKDLVAGSGLTFADAGEQELKGIPGRWRLYEQTG